MGRGRTREIRRRIHVDGAWREEGGGWERWQRGVGRT